MTQTSKRVRAKIVIPSCRLSVTEGPDAGKTQEWNKRLIRIGRDDDNDFVLTDPAISGCHFILEHDPERGGYQLIDQQSTNGVWSDQLQLLQAYLNSRTLLTVGDSVLEFSPHDRWIDKTVGVPEDNLDSEDSLSYQAPTIQDLFARISCLADVDIPIIFLGETGTGKSTLAAQLHQMSQRREQPFVHVNCSAIPPELFESEFFGHKRGAFTGAHRDHDGFFARARHGILFLDEIAELSLDNQTKLLTVLEHQCFYPLGSKEKETTDIRLLTATNQNLYEAVQKGRFREDLYYRIVVIECIVPSLRERPGDIEVLAQYFLDKFLAKHPNKPRLTLSQTVKDIFLNYRWPGNIRELNNAILSSATYASNRPGTLVELLPQDLPIHLRNLAPSTSSPSQPKESNPSANSSHPAGSTQTPLPSDTIDPGAPKSTPSSDSVTPSSLHFPPYHPPFPPYEQERKRVLGEFQRTYLQSILAHTGGNVSRVSDISGIARPHIYAMMRDLGVSKK